MKLETRKQEIRKLTKWRKRPFGSWQNDKTRIAEETIHKDEIRKLQTKIFFTKGFFVFRQKAWPLLECWELPGHYGATSSAMKNESIKCISWLTNKTHVCPTFGFRDNFSAFVLPTNRSEIALEPEKRRLHKKPWFWNDSHFMSTAAPNLKTKHTKRTTEQIICLYYLHTNTKT